MVGENGSDIDAVTDYENKSVEWSVIKYDVITAGHAIWYLLFDTV